MKVHVGVDLNFFVSHSRSKHKELKFKNYVTLKLELYARAFFHFKPLLLVLRHFEPSMNHLRENGI